MCRERQRHRESSLQVGATHKRLLPVPIGLQRTSNVATHRKSIGRSPETGRPTGATSANTHTHITPATNLRGRPLAALPAVDYSLLDALVLPTTRARSFSSRVQFAAARVSCKCSPPSCLCSPCCPSILSLRACALCHQIELVLRRKL